MMPHDPWQSRLLESQTIRSKKSIKASMLFAAKSPVVYNIPHDQSSDDNNLVDLTRNTETSTHTIERSNNYLRSKVNESMQERPRMPKITSFTLQSSPS